MEQIVYTTDELAAMLSVHKKTLMREIRAGELKAYKRFSRWYVTRADVLEYIRAGECPALSIDAQPAKQD